MLLMESKWHVKYRELKSLAWLLSMVLKENSHHGELYVILQSKNNLSHLFHLWKNTAMAKKNTEIMHILKTENFYSPCIFQNKNFFNFQ